MIDLYHQIKTPIDFYCRQRLNPRSLIQPSEILLVKLIGTHMPKIFDIAIVGIGIMSKVISFNIINN